MHTGKSTTWKNSIQHTYYNYNSKKYIHNLQLTNTVISNKYSHILASSSFSASYICSIAWFSLNSLFLFKGASEVSNKSELLEVNDVTAKFVFKAIRTHKQKFPISYELTRSLIHLLSLLPEVSMSFKKRTSTVFLYKRF